MSQESEKGGEERRKRKRRMVAVVADIATEARSDSERIGIIRDISTIGARLLTYVDLAIGDELDLVLRLPDRENEEPRSRRVAAKVVRTEPLKQERRGLWQNVVAVEFEEEIENFDDEIKELSDLAEKLAGA